MDIHLQGNSQLYGVNGGAHPNSRTGSDTALQSLSQDEQDCIRFFEDTIGSLEDSLVEDEQRSALVKPPQRVPVGKVDGLTTPKPNPGFTVPLHQDIIDLVHPEPDLVSSKEPAFNPTNPDFRLIPTPESHFEVKPRHDSLPLGYNPSFTDSHSPYHPPGCIPTPVLIAQKIAENQAGGMSNLPPSLLLRRLSLEAEKPSSDSTEPPPKQGPPTSAKPTRFPANISINLGNKEAQKQPAANLNIQEKREQMLANLPGTSHPLLQEHAEQKARNTPTRSISFKDPSPDKSRMEALSKLGLTRARAMSGETARQATPNVTTVDSQKGPDTGSTCPEASFPPLMHGGTTFPESSAVPSLPSHIPVDRKPELLQTQSIRSHDDRSSPLSPSSPTSTYNRHYPPPLEYKAPAVPAAPPAVEFNHYGGKSITVHPSVPPITEHSTSPTSQEPKTFPSALSNPTELNNYGGKSKVMIPSTGPMSRSNLPDILSSHMDRSQSPPSKAEPHPPEQKVHRGKSQSLHPATGPNPARSFKAPVPTPAPKPARHSYHGALAQKAAVTPPDHKRRSNSMFRPQGITVQFSGRGEMNDSRREALRRLGLLKTS